MSEVKTCCSSHKKPIARHVTTPVLTESGRPAHHSCGGHLWHTSKPVPMEVSRGESCEYRYCTNCSQYIVCVASPA